MSTSIRILPSAANRAASLVRTIQHTHPPSCPCHGSSTQNAHLPASFLPSIAAGTGGSRPRDCRSLATPATDGPPRGDTDYAFEMSSASIRFGSGCTAEAGMDVRNLGAKRVCLVTDRNLRKLHAVETAERALQRENIEYEIFDRVTVEPKDSSVKEAIDFAKPYGPDAFLAVGGGSCIDTAKLMNLYTTFPDAAFLDFVNAPLGRGLPITRPLKPLIAVPTTSGTGSETTGTAIFDLPSKRAKTGIASRALRPTLGLCDPLNARTMPRAVLVSSGLDVLCHALESWTAIPYHRRSPRPADPIQRPAYQGANPISDIFAQWALRATFEHLPRAAADPEDLAAHEQMMLAATLAGVGFGNAGVHLCHGMSYPISSQNPRDYKHEGYETARPLIPHGVSVAVTAPAVFRFTAAADPERHLAAAACLGKDVSRVKAEDAGAVLADAITEFLVRLGDQPRGLTALGFGRGDVEALVEGTIPQKRVLMLAPQLATELEKEREQLHRLFEDAMTY